MPTGVACPQCGAPIEPGQQFCKSCGRNISGVQGDVATRQVRVDATMTAQMQRGIRDALQEATLGDYEILAELGRGGMATVFLAHDIQLDRKVAIKVMSPALLEGEGMIERFKLEARTAAGLSHPHIIPIYAVRETEQLLYFVMKFIEGRALDSIIETAAPLPVPLVQNVITKVAEALGYAHRQGVVHRDIKPANIMIDTEGMPIVTDFGIAKVASKQGLTMTGATIGTPTYMSPEQCNAGQITGASDQYSLGCVAYEMLTGHPPFDGDSVLTIMFKHVSEPAPAPESLGPDCPPELAAAVRKMLAKKPEDRFPTIEAAAAAIGGTTLAYDDPIRTQMMDFAKEGAALQVLKRVSTPRSPIPVTRTRQRTSPSAKTVRMSTGEITGGHAAKPKRRTGLWIGLSAVVLVGAAVALWLKPWVGTSTAAQPVRQDSATVPAPAQTPPAGPTVSQGDSQAAAPVATVGGAGAAQTPKPKPAVPAGPAPVASVAIVGAPGQLAPGESVALRADLRDGANHALSGRAVRWSSSAPGVARVDANGRVTAVSTGSATIEVESEGQRGTATITVSPVPVARVDLRPAGGSMEAGKTLQLTATALAADGSTLDRTVTWSSSNASVATVANDGMVTARAAGTAVISASAGGRTGSANVTVTPHTPTAAELRALVDTTIHNYGKALEDKDIAAVRRLYVGISSDAESKLRDALSGMRNLAITFTISGVRVSGSTATASVSQEWSFMDNDGHQQDLPGKYTYTLRRDGAGWVIVEIK